MSAFGFDPEEILRRRPRVVRTGGAGSHPRRRWFLWGTIAVLLVVIVLGRQFLSLTVSYLFFDSMGHTNVFWTPFVTQVVLFLIGFALTGLLVGVSVPAWRAAARNLDERGARYALLGGLAVTAFAAIIGGLSLAGQWQDILLWAHHHDFGATDPVFGQDYGFFVFTLPVVDAFSAIGWTGVLVGLGGAVALAALSAVAINAPAEVPFPLKAPEGRRAEDGLRIALRHVGIALVALFVMASLGAHFGVFHLATSQHDNFWGLDATQRNVVRPVLGALQFIALGFAALTAFFVIQRWKREPAVSGGIFSGALVLWLIVAAALQGIPAAIYQATTVTPNALSAQSGPITDFLTTSRYAWGLQDTVNVQSRPFPTPSPVTLTDLAADPSTLNNVRIQDYRQLPDALNQTDRSRSYQTYPTITVDRYPGQTGAPTEVMVGPREISADNLPSNTFINRSLIYTHGYGISAVSVNRAGDSGKPYLLTGKTPLQQVAPDAPPDLYFKGNPTADPRIYCGLSTSQNVVVNTTQGEVDYPSASGDQTSHAGNDMVGISVGNVFTKAALSLDAFGGTDLFLTNALTPQSQVLLHRTIADRVATLAPFLTVDNDPYVVADQTSGHLVYIADAYIKSDRFPSSFQLADGTSYMRNAVKAVVDAKTCKTTLYAVDMNEPMTATYNDIYPGLLTPLDQMPMYLRSHLRYPEDLLTAQSTVYASIHVDPKDPSVFFNNSDRWRLAQEVVNGTTQDTQAYYVELTLPQDNHPSFVLLQTFSPASGNNGGQANNMTSWLAAQCDYTTSNQPKLVSVRLQNNANVLGPLQFDNNINNDPKISSALSLLNQGGSHVILGNVIILPFANHSFLYVRPLYVAATGTSNSSFPQLQKVIVGTQTAVAMDNDFQSALQDLFTTSQPIPGLAQPTAIPTATPSPSPGGTPGPSPSATPTIPSSFPPAAIPVVQDLLSHEQAYEADVAKQDFTSAGREQDAIKADVAKINAILSTSK